MGESSSDLAGHCNTLTLWMRKTFWVCLAVCVRALSCWKSQRYVVANTVQQPSLFLTVLLQTVVPVAFLRKRHNFRLERNLLRRDEVVRKRSSRGVVLRGLPDLNRSATFPVCWILFSSRLIVDSWCWKCRATTLADMPVVSIPIALSRCSKVIPGRRGMTFDIDFQKCFSSFCAYDKKALELCTVWPAGIIRFVLHILHVIFIYVKIYDYVMA